MNRLVLCLLATVLVVAAIATVAVAAPAQRPHSGPGMSGDQAAMVKELGLTDKQVADVKAILHDHETKMQELMKSTLSPQDKQAKREQLRKDMMTSIQAVLTPAQFEKAKQLMAERREDGPEAWVGFLKGLNLSDDQKTKIKAIFEDVHSKVQAVQADKTLTPQQKMERVMKLRQGARQQIIGLLTPEQRQQIESHRAEMQGAHRGVNNNK